MKILSLSLHNIASIEGPFTLDLEAEPLKSVGLFAITGATGAGKSTILDAICLALYNDTPRLSTTKSSLSITDGLNEVKVNNVKNLLRKGAVTGYAKVVFQAIDGKAYEAQWQVSRAYNKASGAIQDEKIQLFCLTDNTLFPENRKTLVLEKIKNLVGLSFEEFTKSVILAQGEFTSFLKANDDKRSEILEKLTGTEIYSKISTQIYETYKQHRNQLQLLEKQLEQVSFFTDEERESLETQLNSNENALKKLQETLSSLKAQQQWFIDQKQYSSQWQEAVKNKENAVAEKESQTDRFAQLAIIEQLQAIKTDIETQQREKTTLLATEKQLREVSTDKDQLIADKARSLTEKTTAETQLSSLKTEYEVALPSIEKAKELEVQLATLNTPLQQKIEALNSKKEVYQQQEVKLADINSHIETGKAYIQQEEAWQEAHRDSEKISKQYLWLYELTNEQQEYITQYSATTQAIEEITAQLSTLKTTLPPNLLSSTDVDSLIKQQKAYMAQIQTYQTDREISKLILFYQQEKTAGEERLQEWKTLYTQENNLLNNLSKERDTAQTAYSTTERIYQKTQIENSQDISSLRQLLKEGEECPVCGAVHHPNAHKTVVVQLIDTVKQEWEQARIALDAVTKDYITKETALKALQERITQQEELNAKQTMLLEHELQRLQASSLFATYPSTEVVAFIETQLEQTKALLSTTENLYEQVGQLKKLTDKQATLLSEKERYQGLLQKNNERWATLQLSAKWKALWQEDLPLFQKKIIEAKTEWEEHTTNIEKYTKRLNSLEQQHTELSAKKQALEKEINALEESIDIEKTLFDQLSSQRKTLLNGREVKEVENSFKQQIAHFTTTATEAQNRYNTLLLKITANEKTLETLEERREIAITHIAEATQKIDTWIDTHYPTQQAYIKAHKYEWATRSHEWLQTERQARQSLEDRIAHYDTIAKEKWQTLETLKLKQPLSLSEEETSAQLTIKTEEESSLHQKVVTQKSLLLNDCKQRETSAHLLQILNEKKIVARQWEQLNELIGSNNGSKFSKYAQQYTLDRLLQYANRQMRLLNKRYTLQRIPESLSLQVIDNDMAAEVRSVYSLSGGESFLVSLALALALSSLSSSKMNVETLFIDEGFGSLDTDTLSVALDALESLQNQGKKVGVISHVQEMVERIAVKVEVQKEGNGRSKIVVS